MHVFVTWKFKKKQINSNREKVETLIVLDAQGAANSIDSGPIWPKFELMQDIMHVFVTFIKGQININVNRENVDISIFRRLGSGELICEKLSFRQNISVYMVI